MKIEIEPIRSEFQELAGSMKCHVKLDKHIDVGSSFRQTDKSYDIRLNPTRIHSTKQLDAHLNSLREALSF